MQALRYDRSWCAPDQITDFEHWDIVCNQLRQSSAVVLLPAHLTDFGTDTGSNQIGTPASAAMVHAACRDHVRQVTRQQLLATSTSY